MLIRERAMPPAKPPKLGSIHETILQLLRANPQGLTIYEIRDGIPDVTVQQHLDKRVRELRYHYSVPLRKRGKADVYVLEGVRAEPAADSGVISARLRAEVLKKAHERCQMCGRTIAEDGIKLQIDHKIPRNWGGETVAENLWAICQLCNGGKRDYFATFDEAEMKSIMTKESVYERIAETLRLRQGTAVPAWLLEFVANFDDYQEDWHKRLRELRYPVIGMKIEVSKRRNPQGKVESFYTLTQWRELPANHKYLIKEYERTNRGQRRP